jgi:hypothetical protein
VQSLRSWFCTVAIPINIATVQLPTARVCFIFAASVVGETRDRPRLLEILLGAFRLAVLKFRIARYQWLVLIYGRASHSNTIKTKIAVTGNRPKREQYGDADFLVNAFCMQAINNDLTNGQRL